MVKRMREAYRWMLEHHPEEPYGILFVVRCRKQFHNIEREFTRWQDGR